MARKAAIAAFVILAVVAGTLLLLQNLQSQYVELRAYTDDAGGLAEGTSVRLNGIPIGYLDRLILTDSRDPQRKIEFTMKVHPRYLSAIPSDSLVGVAATNLLGNYYIDIVQGHSPTHTQAGAELKTTASSDPNKLLAQMGYEFQEITAIIDRANKLITDVPQGHGNIGLWEKNGINRMNSISVESKKLMDSIQNSHGNLSRLNDLGAQTDTTQKRLDDLIAGFQNGQGTAGKLQALSAEIDGLNKDAKQLTTDLNSDHGPSARIAKLQTTFDDLGQHFQTAVDRMNSGQGTLGLLTVNPQLSNAFANASADFQAVAKGIQDNPRKFLSFTVKLF